MVCLTPGDAFFLPFGVRERALDGELPALTERGLFPNVSSLNTRALGSQRVSQCDGVCTRTHTRMHTRHTNTHTPTHICAHTCARRKRALAKAPCRWRWHERACVPTNARQPPVCHDICGSLVDHDWYRMATNDCAPTPYNDVFKLIHET